MRSPGWRAARLQALRNRAAAQQKTAARISWRAAPALARANAHHFIDFARGEAKKMKTEIIKRRRQNEERKSA
jgi:hypothetical protein